MYSRFGIGAEGEADGDYLEDEDDRPRDGEERRNIVGICSCCECELYDDDLVGVATCGCPLCPTCYNDRKDQ